MGRDELKEYIWDVVEEQVIKYCARDIGKSAITYDTKATDIFPTHLSKNEPYTDEEADRYGLMILSAFNIVNQHFDLSYKVDFAIRKEFELFPKLGDVSRYIFSKVASEILKRGDGDETGG